MIPLYSEEFIMRVYYEEFDDFLEKFLQWENVDLCDINNLSYQGFLIKGEIENKCYIKIYAITYSYLSNKRRVTNKRGVWKKYLNLIKKGLELTKGLEFL